MARKINVLQKIILEKKRKKALEQYFKELENLEEDMREEHRKRRILSELEWEKRRFLR